MVLYGASGHAKVIIDICKLQNKSITKIIDDDINKTKILDFNVSHSYKQEDFIEKKCIISIGNNYIRKKIAESLNCEFDLAIHPSTVIDKTVLLGVGTVIMANATINSSVKIGNHCIINTSSSVDHDCIINDFVHVSPNTTLCGHVVIGEKSHIGAGAVVLPNVSIGKNCIVGAGAIIINSIPDNCTVVGNPGKIIKIKNK